MEKPKNTFSLFFKVKNVLASVVVDFDRKSFDREEFDREEFGREKFDRENPRSKGHVW